MGGGPQAHRPPARQGPENGQGADRRRCLTRARFARARDCGPPIEMYEEWGGAPGAGVVTVIGSVAGRRVMVVANDATVKAGACFPMTIKKILRAQTIAGQNRLPLVYLVDSSGVFLPMQDEVFPDEDDFGRIFRNNAVLSAAGIPQYAAIMGNCVAGGAYLAGLVRHGLDDRGLGPVSGRAGPGEGGHRPGDLARGARRCARPRGHQRHGRLPRAGRRRLPGQAAPTDRACCRPTRRRSASRTTIEPPARPADDLYTLVSSDPSAQYDVRDLLAAILDGGRLDEYRAEYGRTLVCGFGSLGGTPLGIVATQRLRFRPEGGGPIQFGGVIYADSADKAARFVLDCNQSRLPILFIQDVNGFDVGRDAERTGIIRRGAKLVSAVSNSTVPKITLIVGHSFGAGHYALCGKAFDPRFIFAWPGARYAVMGAQQAARTMLDVNVGTLKRQGKAGRRRRARRHGRRASSCGTIARPTSATRPRGSGSTRSSTRPKPARS